MKLNFNITKVSYSSVPNMHNNLRRHRLVGSPDILIAITTLYNEESS